MALVGYSIESTVLYPEMCNVLRSASQGAHLCRHSGCDLDPYTRTFREQCGVDQRGEPSNKHITSGSTMS